MLSRFLLISHADLRHRRSSPALSHPESLHKSGSLTDHIDIGFSSFILPQLPPSSYQQLHVDKRFQKFRVAII